jgi:hypothetical protein
MQVEAFFSDAAIEALDESVLGRPPWVDEFEQDSPPVGPSVQSFAAKLGSIVGADKAWLALFFDGRIQYATNSLWPDPRKVVQPL